METRKNNSDAGEQLSLIETDTPATNAAKKNIKEYEQLQEENREQHAADRIALKAKKMKVFEAVQAAGFKPDAEGAYHIALDGKDWTISQDSELKIKKHAIKDSDSSDDDDDDDEGDGGDPVEGNEPGLRERKGKTA